MSDSRDEHQMRRALELAAKGQGYVEPNPMVGCVIAHGDRVVGEGWHARFGGPHAEVAALEQAGEAARGATMWVTLEPCCHQGKTPPCSQAVIDAGIQRVVVSMADPFAEVDGGGLRQLTDAGIEVQTGVLVDEARQLNAPYLKLIETKRPWVIAKWAMTLDGKLATASGDSQWISNEASREIVHQIRGRVDAVVVGRGTAEADDPLLTARPAGPRLATRVVLDSEAALSLESRLVQSAGDAPVLIASSQNATDDAVKALEAAGCEVLKCAGDDRSNRAAALLDELGRRRMTNVLVEGGGSVLGAFFQGDLIDEVHVFVAPKIAGGAEAISPVGGHGIDKMADSLRLLGVQTRTIDDDVYITGRTANHS